MAPNSIVVILLSSSVSSTVPEDCLSGLLLYIFSKQVFFFEV